MKTFYQFNESIGKALFKLGKIGLRKLPKYLPKYKSQIPKKVSKLFKPKNIEKFETKTNKIVSKSTEFGKPATKSHEIKRELGANLIAKNQIKNNQPFYGTTPPLAVNKGVQGYRSGVSMSPTAGETQLYGKLKGAEYKPRMSGKGDKGPLGTVTGYRGKGNKALRRSGQSDKITDYEGTGRKPTPMFRKTEKEMGTLYKKHEVYLDPSNPKPEPHKWKAGDIYMQSVDIKQSRANSRAIRNQLKAQQKREASLRKGNKGMEKEIEAMRRRLESGN